MSGRTSALTIIGVGTAIIIGLVAGGHFGGLRINLTLSYPLGLWRIEPLERPVAVGDLIFICPPDTPTFRQAAERGYLRRGLCPSWLSPLIKTVVATSGQHVAADMAVTIDGELLASSALRLRDAEGRVLFAHDGGVVPPGHLFLHSDYAGSYDSRYFGPIPDTGLLGLAQPVLTYAP
jgi:conjugative transfer signal peptidase TraF